MPDFHQQVAAFIESPGAGEDEFNALALALFGYQYERIPVVKKLADAAGKRPDQLLHWRDIPAVPTPTFKHFDLFAGDPSHADHVFHSSGTSGAEPSRSLFSKSGLQLMELSVRINAQKMLLNDGRATRILVLAPPPQAAPHMIMAWGMERLIQHFGLDGSRFLIGPGGMDPKEVVGELTRAAAEGTPITLIGASFGFVHLLDGLAAAGAAIKCAPGSRTMDAGGYKGRSRELTRGELDDAITANLGIPAERNVNLLGMTELASQFYDGVLAQSAAAPRRKTNARWTRTQVLNASTLEAAEPGESGLLWHLDLANVERPCVIRTNDVGVADAQGWNILGRAQGAESRGCSLTVDELLS